MRGIGDLFQQKCGAIVEETSETHSIRGEWLWLSLKSKDTKQSHLTAEVHLFYMPEISSYTSIIKMSQHRAVIHNVERFRGIHISAIDWH